MDTMDGPLQSRREDRRRDDSSYRYHHDDQPRSRSPARPPHTRHRHDPSLHHHCGPPPDRSHYDNRRPRWEQPSAPRSHDQSHNNHRRHHHDHHERGGPPRHQARRRDHQRRGASPKQAYPEYYVKDQPTDENLPHQLQTDPRGQDPSQRITQKASHRGAGRNTESFDPASTLVRPEMRVQVGSSRAAAYAKVLKHDDVVIVPELFGQENDWKLYYQLVQEMTALQKDQIKGSEWLSWHEGAHLIVKKPQGSTTFQSIIDRLCVYFNIRKESIGYRFNWCKFSSEKAR